MRLMSLHLGSLVPAVALLIATTAGADTLNFQDGVYDVSGPTQTYTEGGFTFETPQGNHFDSNTSPSNPIVPGVPYLVFHESANNPINNLITLTHENGNFDFTSFDLIFDTPILAFNPIINPSMIVTASDGSTLVTPVGAAPGFVGTINTNWTDISFVTFDILSNSAFAGNVLFDNAVVSPVGPPVAGQVPLPSSAWLLLCGFAGLSGLGLRKNRMN